MECIQRRLTGGAQAYVRQPRKHELRVTDRDGRRWLQQWAMPQNAHVYERAWVDAAELPTRGGGD